MSFPKKEERNKDLIKKYHQGWSAKKLGEYFGINAKTAWELHGTHCKDKNCPRKSD